MNLSGHRDRSFNIWYGLFAILVTAVASAGFYFVIRFIATGFVTVPMHRNQRSAFDLNPPVSVEFEYAWFPLGAADRPEGR